MELNAARVRLSLMTFLLIVVLLGGVHQPSANAQTGGIFRPTGNMTTGRSGHTATLLVDGRVLIVGGTDNSSAEIYDPATGAFTPTGSTTWPRLGGHSATLLADGRVLIAGGRLTDSAEIYDPATGAFTPTGKMVSAQFGHAAMLLDNGMVLIAGGELGPPYPRVASAEIYDPPTGLFSSTGGYAGRNSLYPSAAGPIWPTATLLPAGKVLLVGNNPAELYDSVAGAFSVTGAMASNALLNGMYWHGTTLLRDGRVLVTGGNDEWFSFASAELYDPLTETFTAVVNMGVARDLHTSTLLPDGTVLIAGGHSSIFNNIIGSAEIFDPETRTFAFTGNMVTDRGDHRATLLKTGEVLITGGAWYGPFRRLDSAELYTPAVLDPPLEIDDLQFDRAIVATGDNFSLNISGSNLTAQTFFDLRFTAPGSDAYNVVLNWQKGSNATHSVPQGTPSGDWTIRGVRPHRIETDHTGDFVPAKATLTVSP